jgi:hypothetical protein
MVQLVAVEAVVEAGVPVKDLLMDMAAVVVAVLHMVLEHGSVVLGVHYMAAVVAVVTSAAEVNLVVLEQGVLAGT